MLYRYECPRCGHGYSQTKPHSHEREPYCDDCLSGDQYLRYSLYPHLRPKPPPPEAGWLFIALVALLFAGAWIVRLRSDVERLECELAMPPDERIDCIEPSDERNE